MSDPLVFMMGEFAAEFPTDRLYAKNHMWAQRREDGYRFGFTAYAVRLLQDVYFLDWTVDPVVQLEARQEIGSIESKKAESALYAPISGQLTTFNEELMDDPSAINVDKYGNTGSASIPLALSEARSEGRISSGDLVLLTAFGAGFHWSAMVLRF